MPSRPKYKQPCGRYHGNLSYLICLSKAQDILSPDCWRKKKRAHHKYKKNSDDGLPSSWMRYNHTVRHNYSLFVFMVSSVFFSASPGLVYLGRNKNQKYNRTPHAFPGGMLTVTQRMQFVDSG